MRALVLGGGGVKGAYQVGALRKWIGEDGIDYDILRGISVGAINCAYLAQMKKGDTKAALAGFDGLWRRVNDSNIKRWWLGWWIAALWQRSLYDSKPLQDWIAKELDVAKIKASGRKLRMVTVSWNSGEPRVVTEDDDELPKWVAASSAFPVMLSPVDIGKESWTDGGVRSVTPLGQAIDAGAPDIDVIMCSAPFGKMPFATGGQYVPGLARRTIDILTDQITRADLQICGLKNHLVRAKAGTNHKHVNVRILEPSEPLADDPLTFDPSAIERMIARGYEDAKTRVKELGPHRV